MHTDTTPKEKPTGSANNPAGHTDSQIVPNAADIGKQFATLRAQFALLGHTVSYLAERWGLECYLPTPGDADKYLIRVGGGRHE